MSGSSLTMRAMQSAAKNKNQTVRYPAPNELFLDIDTEADWKLFQDNFLILFYVFDKASFKSKPSKSGLPHRHVVVDLGTAVPSQRERILLQAVLGSDRKHELLSYLAALGGGTPHPTVFFE